MATQSTSMTTSEFAKAAGVPAAGITRLIRDGKLKAKKTGGKWMIPQSQLASGAVRALKGSAAGAKNKAPAAKTSRSRPAPKVRSVRLPSVIETDPEPLRQTVVPPEPLAPAPSAPETRSEEKTYTISEFAAMTYLTKKGVTEWLKIGRIKGVQKENGEWRVLDSNIQVPDISRLLRK